MEFEFVWIGPYSYRDHLLDNFRHGRMLFIGDAAHVVSPFGARGGNSGIQDAANLGWKLALVVQGERRRSAARHLRCRARQRAAENLRTSRVARRAFWRRASPAEHTLRRAAVALARAMPFARPLINTGRMSVANPYRVGARLPQGGRTVQNLQLKWRGGAATSLMELLAENTQCVGFCSIRRLANS